MYATLDLYSPLREFISPFASQYLLPTGIGHGESANSLGLGWIYYGLARVLPASKVLCIGSAFGFVPAVFGLALSHNGRGEVYFVDASFDYEVDGVKSYAGCGHWREVGARPFREMGLTNVHLTIATTQEYEWTGGLIDILFIDGDHSFHGVRHDFEKFSPYANYVFLHDSAWRPDGSKQVYGEEPAKEIAEIERAVNCGIPEVRRFVATLDRPKVSIPVDSGVILIDNRGHRKDGER